MRIRNLYIFLVIMSGLVISSCARNNATESSKKASSGKTLELLVAADKEVYQGEIQDVIDSIFSQPQEALNQYEPLVDVVYIPQTSLYNTEMFKAHRNIIIIDKNSENDNKVYAHEDYWSYPQIVYEFAVTDNINFIELIQKYYPVVLKKIYEKERIRVNKAFKKMENIEITKQLKQNFGFWLTFSDEFRVSTLNKEFAWIRKEAKDFSLGVLIYTMPYKDSAIFKLNNIIALRDKITKEYIPGPAEGSYMTTEKRIDFITNRVLLNGHPATETRGLWRLEGDFMGGPFINYMLLDEKKSKVIMIDGYVYSPRKPKRDFLMQVESVIYTLQFL